MAESRDKVKCLECGREFKGLSAHVATHDLKLKAYIDKHRDPISGDPPPVGYAGNHIGTVQTHKKDTEQAVRKYNVPDSYKLTAEEKRTYNDKYEVLFAQADEDPALETSLHELVLGEIFISRYLAVMSDITNRMTKAGKFMKDPNTGQDDEATLKTLATQVKTTQETSLKLMDKLNLTREKKKQSREVIKSTPSRLVSALDMLLRNYTPEMHAKHQREMDEAQRWMVRNLNEIKRSIGNSAQVQDLQNI